MTPQITARKKLAAKLKDSRVARGMTQARLAELLGYDTPQFISILERGQSAIPLEPLGMICGIFGWDINEIALLLVSDKQMKILSELNRGFKKVLVA